MHTVYSHVIGDGDICLYTQECTVDHCSTQNCHGLCTLCSHLCPVNERD